MIKCTMLAHTHNFELLYDNIIMFKNYDIANIAVVSYEHKLSRYIFKCPDYKSPL